MSNAGTLGLISVCVPTHRRPAMLLEAVASVVRQSYRPLEVVVGDDSPAREAAASHAAVEQLAGDRPLTYLANDPPLGQAANVNRLFAAAGGSHVLLLHDDDLLLPSSIAALAAALSGEPEAVAAYGRQRVLGADGLDLGDAAANRLNATYHRDADRAGVQEDSLSMTLLRQFPNDGYLLRTGVARAIGYRPPSEVGHACDADFAVRIGLRHPRRSFVLVDAETAAYRLSQASIARDGSAAAASYYRVLAGLEVPPHAEAARRRAMGDLAADACGDLLRLGRRGEALRVWLGPAYGRRRFGARGLAAGVSAVVPGAGRLLRAARDRRRLPR